MDAGMSRAMILQNRQSIMEPLQTSKTSYGPEDTAETAKNAEKPTLRSQRSRRFLLTRSRSGRVLATLRDGDARDALEIAADADERQLGRLLEQVFDLDVLAEPELQDQIAAGAQTARCFRGQPVEQAHPVDAAE